MTVVTEHESFSGSWALILGVSSGFGAAVALELARRGMNIFGVHLDRSSTLPRAEALAAEIQGMGRQVQFFNTNAASEGKRAEVLDAIQARLAGAGNGRKVRVLLHSLAFGSMGAFVADDAKQALKQSQVEMTLDVMANSLVYWTRDLVGRDLLETNSRIFAMTSSGSHRIWAGYGAVSAAKACLESHVRQLAVELATRGVTVNAVRAGVTDTPAARVIPGFDKMAHEAATRNPMGRMTRPEDVAATIGALCDPGTYWLTGNVLGVDGGEDNIG